MVARLSLFPTGAELTVLASIARAGGRVAGALAGRDAPALASILARLARLGLASASADGSRYATHPFLAEYFQSLLGAPPEEIHAAPRAVTSRPRLDAHGPGPTEAGRLDAYEALLVSTLRAGHADEAAEIYLRRLGGFAHLGLRLGEMSRGARVLAAFSVDGDPAQITPALAPHRRARRRPTTSASTRARSATWSAPRAATAPTTTSSARPAISPRSPPACARSPTPSASAAPSPRPWRW